MSLKHKKLYRSRENRVVAGVCGGFGEYFSYDPIFIRFVAVIFLILTGFFPGVIIYVAAVLLIPPAPEYDFRETHTENSERV